MIFLNPQWQGSGLTDELKTGSETLKTFFRDYEIIEIPLSNKDLTTIDNIKCFEPILEQTNSFRDIISKRRPEKVSTIGGDCGIEVIPVSYLNHIYQGDLCIIWIDAHADLNTPESSPSHTFHGMPLRTLLGEGNSQIKELLFSTIEPEQICFVGLRDIDKPEKEYIAEKNIKSISQCSFSDLKDKAEAFKNIYIHLDLDVLDKSEFEHTLFPTGNGFKIEAVLTLISAIKKSTNVVGMCITESNATHIEQLEPISKILEEIEI